MVSSIDRQVIISSRAFDNLSKEQMNNLFDITKHFQEQFNLAKMVDFNILKIQIPVIPEGFLNNIEHLNNIALSFPLNDDFVNNEETELEYEKIEIELVQELKSNPGNIFCKINELAEKVTNKVSKIKEKLPAVFLLLWFIQNIILPIFNSIEKDTTINIVLNEIKIINDLPKQNVRDIKNSLRSEYTISEPTINQVRVATREIPVYQSNKVSSNILDKLIKNKPVIVLEKRRNWSYVIYSTEENEEMAGWVFTRYLQG